MGKATPTTEIVLWKGPEPEPFYGWRYLRQTLPDGRQRLEQVPLTYADLLDPQESDEISENTFHEQARTDLVSVLRTRLPTQRGFRVHSDLIIDWGIPGMRRHSPDVFVFAEVTNPPDTVIGTYRVALHGGRPLLLIEIVSPDRRDVDVEDKFADYHAVGVPCYVILDQQREGAPRVVRGYRHTAQGYELLPTDEQGRVELGPAGLLLGIRADRVVCVDRATGAEVGDYVRLTEDLETAHEISREAQREAEAAEERRRQEVEARREAERQRTEAEQQRAEAERQRTEADRGRQEAERQRIEAEKRQREETEARRAAEDRAAQEQKRAADLEEQLRQLREQLSRLQSAPPNEGTTS